MSINSENLSELDYQREPAKVPINPDNILNPPSLSTGPDKPHLLVFGTAQKTTAEPTSLQDKGWPYQSTTTGYQDNPGSKYNKTDDTSDTNESKGNSPQKLAAGLAGAAAVVAAGTLLITTQYRRDNPGTGVSLSPPNTPGGSGTGVNLSGPEPTPYSGGPGTGVSLSGTPTPTITTTAKNSPQKSNPTGGGVANGDYNGGNLPIATAPTGNNPTASGNSASGGGGGYGGSYNGGNGYGATNTGTTTNTGNPNTATAPDSGSAFGWPFGGSSNGPGGSLPFGSKTTPGSIPGDGGGATEIAADIKKISELVDALKAQQTLFLNAVKNFGDIIRRVFSKNINTAIRDHMVYGSQLEGDLGKLATETMTKWIQFLVDGGNEWRKNHSTAAPEIIYAKPPAYVVTALNSACYVITDVFPPDMKAAFKEMDDERDHMLKAIEEMQTLMNATPDWWKGLLADTLRSVWKKDIFDKKDENNKKLEDFRMHFGILMADVEIRDLG